MQYTRLLESLTNDKIEFVTLRSDQAAMPTIGRRVVVTGPLELVQLLSVGDVRVLDELVRQLLDPKRAWAAEVMLASLTRNEEDIVNAFAAHPDHWLASVGKDANGRWEEWLRSHRGKLMWNEEARAFEER